MGSHGLTDQTGAHAAPRPRPRATRRAPPAAPPTPRANRPPTPPSVAPGATPPSAREGPGRRPSTGGRPCAEVEGTARRDEDPGALTAAASPPRVRKRSAPSLSIGDGGGPWRGRVWQRGLKAARKLPRGCPPHVPGSYAQQSRRAPKLSKICPQVAQQLPNKYSGSRDLAQIRPVRAEPGHVWGGR